jgi:hypothetical protein
MTVRISLDDAAEYMRQVLDFAWRYVENRGIAKESARNLAIADALFDRLLEDAANYLSPEEQECMTLLVPDEFDS